MNKMHEQDIVTITDLVEKHGDTVDEVVLARLVRRFRELDAMASEVVELLEAADLRVAEALATAPRVS